MKSETIIFERPPARWPLAGSQSGAQSLRMIPDEGSQFLSWIVYHPGADISKPAIQAGGLGGRDSRSQPMVGDDPERGSLQVVAWTANKSSDGTAASV
jgi:hypothetical protein